MQLISPPSRHDGIWVTIRALRAQLDRLSLRAPDAVEVELLEISARLSALAPKVSRLRDGEADPALLAEVKAEISLIAAGLRALDRAP